LDDTSSTNGARQVDPFEEVYTTDYVVRLLLERHHIYARLINQGGSIILTAADTVDHDRDTGYSTEIGNSFHLDLIDLAQQLKKLSKSERDALLSYTSDMTADQAAPFLGAKGGVSVRQRRKRAIDRLIQVSNE
jgi:hypothetical protein